MKKNRTNLKPAVIFVMMVLGCLLFGLFAGYIELSSFSDKNPVTESPEVESLDYSN